MIIDTSAAVTMLRDEPEADEFRERIEAARAVRMSVASVLELAMVIGRSDPGLTDLFIEEFGVELVAVDAEQLKWARHAYEQFGRGSGSPARLNYGDCLVYGAARAAGEPLLFTGDDFGHTDLELVR